MIEIRGDKKVLITPISEEKKTWLTSKSVILYGWTES